MKRCSKCGEERDVSEFHRSKRGAGGRASQCKHCDREYQRSLRGRYRDREVSTSPKACSRCKETKEATEFNRDRSSKDGLSGECRKCASDRARAKRNDPTFREAKNEWRRQWRKENPEKNRQANRDYYLRNKERLTALNKANKERHKREDPEGWAYANRSYVHRYKARRKAATIERVDYKNLLRVHGMVCHICGDSITERRGTTPRALTFDHVIPLSRGGAHSEANIRPAHFFCNTSKHAKILTTATVA